MHGGNIEQRNKKTVSQYLQQNSFFPPPPQLHVADSSEHAASIRVKKHKNHSTKAIQARVTSFVCTSREEGRCTPRGPEAGGDRVMGAAQRFLQNCVGENRLRPQMCLSLGF